MYGLYSPDNNYVVQGILFYYKVGEVIDLEVLAKLKDGSDPNLFLASITSEDPRYYNFGYIVFIWNNSN